MSNKNKISKSVAKLNCSVDNCISKPKSKPKSSSQDKVKIKSGKILVHNHFSQPNIFKIKI
jgi:hypothetical protein